MRTLRESILDRRGLMDKDKDSILIPQTLEEIFTDFIKRNNEYFASGRKLGMAQDIPGISVKKIIFDFIKDVQDLDILPRLIDEIEDDIKRKLPRVQVNREVKRFLGKGKVTAITLYLSNRNIKSLSSGYKDKYGGFMRISISKDSNRLYITTDNDSDLYEKLAEVYRKVVK